MNYFRSLKSRQSSYNKMISPLKELIQFLWQHRGTLGYKFIEMQHK
jgi:hypothetical protein